MGAFRCDRQTALGMHTPNANYHQAQNVFRGTIRSKGERDGSHMLWQSGSKLLLLVVTEEGPNLLV